MRLPWVTVKAVVVAAAVCHMCLLLLLLPPPGDGALHCTGSLPRKGHSGLCSYHDP